MPNDTVELRGYDQSGTVVLREAYTTLDWYEKVHPIIDSDEERVQAGIRTIEGSQYGEDGKATVTWRLTYSETGKIVEEWVWEAGSPMKHRSF